MIDKKTRDVRLLISVLTPSPLCVCRINSVDLTNRNGLPGHLVRPARVVSKDLRHVPDVSVVRHFERLAVVQ